MKRLSGLVAARTHVSIAAYSTFVPTLVIGYSVKARGIARDLFGEEAGHLLPAQELSGEAELIAAYDALMKRGDAERGQLRKTDAVVYGGAGGDAGRCVEFGERKMSMRQTVTKEPGGMHGLRRVREHMPEAGDYHAAGHGGISVSEGGRGKVRFLRLVRKALPGGAGNAGTPRASVRRAGQGRGPLRGQSSSGGVFTLLAREVIRQGGVVFGAAFDEALHVEHIGAFDESELSGMRGSKYVQSDAADAIGNAVSLLKRDIPVLFSGTPCQISGLMAALGGTKTDKLLTVDFVCHGVPSPGVFASYLAELEKERGSRRPRLCVPR